MNDHLFSRDSCVTCDSATPSCNCASGEQCILTSRTCNQCPTIQCIKSASSSSGSVNPGVIAGPIVAVLVIASLGLFWWMRKKKRRDLARLEELAERARKAEQAGFQLSQPGSPLPGSGSTNSHRNSSLPLPPPSASRRSHLPPAPVNAEYYDENGATIRVYNGNVGTIHVDQKTAANGDPFSDRQSISTMGSGGTANIIPIQWIPPSKSDERLSLAKDANAGAGGKGQSAAARLDAARQNLFAPRRPARSPDLDLRLHPNAGIAASDGELSASAPSAFNPRSPASSSNIRDSYLSGNSAAPSYWSGQSDIHLDAPMIVTSKQVQIGRLQQAEMVQFGGGKSPHVMELIAQGKLSPVRDEEDPCRRVGASGDGDGTDELSPSTMTSFATGQATMRTLTPTSNRQYINTNEEEEEGLRSGGEEPTSAGAVGDLRFSMGSLAYRDSVSTIGTSRYLASAISTGFPQHSHSYSHSTNLPPPVPRAPAAQVQAGDNGDRESFISSKSFADSVLGAFPMIPPSTPGRSASGISALPSLPSGLGVPQSTSSNTLHHVGGGGNANVIPRPPPSYRPTQQGGQQQQQYIRQRPETQDSFLGTFPFVPPNVDDLAGLPSASLPTAADKRQSQGQRGVSTFSEGLGGFEFKLDERPPLPNNK